MTSGSIRKPFRPMSAANSSPMPALIQAATGETLTSRKKSSTSARPNACGWKAENWSSTTGNAPAACTASTSCPEPCSIGKDTGLSILVGAKAPILDGAQMGSLLVPFIKVEEPYDEIKEVIESVWDWWMEEGKNRERLGELIKRQGFQKLLEVTNIEADAAACSGTASNPYIFWKEEEVEGGFERDINEFRKHHQR